MVRIVIDFMSMPAGNAKLLPIRYDSPQSFSDIIKFAVRNTEAAALAMQEFGSCRSAAIGARQTLHSFPTALKITQIDSRGRCDTIDATAERAHSTDDAHHAGILELQLRG